MTPRQDYLTTFITEAVVIGSYLLTYRLVAHRLGSAGFGEYALSRRVLSFLAPLALLGVDFAVTRLVAFAAVRDADRGPVYPVAALAIMCGALLPLTIVLVGLRAPIAALFFGSDRYTALVLSLPVLLLGSSLHGIAYGYLRGRLKIRPANLLMGLNYGIVPIAAVLVGSSVPLALTEMGIGWSLISSVFLAASPLGISRLRQRASEVSQYGFPRFPGNLLQLGLFASPGIVIAHATDIRAAGVVAFGVATLGMIGSAVAPIGFVFLPVATRLVAQASFDQLKSQVWMLIKLTVPALLLVVLGLELFSDGIVRIYLGRDYLSTVPVLRLMILGALPWGIFSVIRSVLDARYVRALNTRNMAFTFACFVAGALLVEGIGFSTSRLVVAFVVSLFVLMGLTSIEVRSAMKVDPGATTQTSLESLPGLN